MNKREMLINNGLDWYVVTSDNGDIELRHSSALSSILECGQDMADFGIETIEQCWNGEDLDKGVMDTINDYRQHYENSGLIDFDHGTNSFDENSFVEFFYRNYSAEDLKTAFVRYLAIQNGKTDQEINQEYSLSK